MNTSQVQDIPSTRNMITSFSKYGLKSVEKKIINLLPSMEEKAFLLDIEVIAEDLGLEKQVLVGRISALLNAKYKVRLLSTIDDAPVDRVDSSRRFDLIPKTRESFDLEKPFLKDAFTRLMANKGIVEYQKARGRAAKPVNVWVKENLIDKGILSAEEVSAMPMWMFQRFDPRLATAFHNAKRNT